MYPAAAADASMDGGGSSMYSKIGSASSGSVLAQIDRIDSLRMTRKPQPQQQESARSLARCSSSSSSAAERSQQRHRIRRKRAKVGYSGSSWSVAMPKLWLLCQLALVGAFALCCAVLPGPRSAPDAAERGAWLYLVFNAAQLTVCADAKKESGCLENATTLIYRTTGKAFGPLVHQNDSYPLDGDQASLQLEGLTDPSYLWIIMNGVRIKKSAAYRVFGQVTYADPHTDLDVGLTIMVNDDPWMHCMINNQVPSTYCTLYGIKYLKSDDMLTFTFKEKLLLISVAPKDTYFSIEKL